MSEGRRVGRRGCNSKVIFGEGKALLRRYPYAVYLKAIKLIQKLREIAHKVESRNLSKKGDLKFVLEMKKHIWATNI